MKGERDRHDPLPFEREIKMHVREATYEEALTVHPELRTNSLMLLAIDDSGEIKGTLALCGAGGARLYAGECLCFGPPEMFAMLLQRARFLAAENGYSGIEFDVDSDSPKLRGMKRATILYRHPNGESWRMCLPTQVRA